MGGASHTRRARGTVAVARRSSAPPARESTARAPLAESASGARWRRSRASTSLGGAHLFAGLLCRLPGVLGGALCVLAPALLRGLRRRGGDVRGDLLAAVERLLAGLGGLCLDLVGDTGPIFSSSTRVDGISMPARKPIAAAPMASPSGFSWAMPTVALAPGA